MTASSEDLQRVLCIWYPVQFQNNEVQALIDSGSEVNAMTPTYATKLGLTAWKTSVGAQKIDGLPLETHGMISARFSLQDSIGRVRFFEETFLLADTNMEVTLGMAFLAFINADFQFDVEELTWRSYIVVEALPITSWVELIDKREFAKAALNKYSATFLMHVATLELPTAMSIHPSRASQLQDNPAKVAAL